jgi:DNA replication protein DnaC
MNLVELDHALRKLRLSGMAAVLEVRLRHAQSEKLAPIDLVSMLVSAELVRRQGRLLERRHKQAGFRDPDRSLDSFDFDFNKKMNRALIHDLATARFIAEREDASGPREDASRDRDRVSRHPARVRRVVCDRSRIDR